MAVFLWFARNGALTGERVATVLAIFGDWSNESLLYNSAPENVNISK